MEELPPPSAAGNDMDHLPVHHNPMTDSRQTMARILSSHKSDLVSSTFKEAATDILLSSVLPCEAEG